jgi:hypothetical protein
MVTFKSADPLLHIETPFSTVLSSKFESAIFCGITTHAAESNAVLIGALTLRPTSVCCSGPAWTNNYWHGLEMHPGSRVGFIVCKDNQSAIVPVFEHGQETAVGVFAFTLEQRSYSSIAAIVAVLRHELKLMHVDVGGDGVDVDVSVIILGTVLACKDCGSESWIRLVPSLSEILATRSHMMLLDVTAADIVVINKLNLHHAAEHSTLESLELSTRQEHVFTRKLRMY